MIDTHCHLTNPQLLCRLEEVIESAHRAGVHTMISVATDGDDALAARQIAATQPSVFFSSGIHPLHADGAWGWVSVKEAAKDEKCVAWGELGLDNHYPEPKLALQEKLLEEHLAIIEGEKDDQRPVIVHCRKAVEELLPIFNSSSISNTRFVFHCFTESEAEAKQIIEFGARISFTGVVTYKNAPQVLAAAELVPIDSIMIETDAPYLSPEPVRKIRPNEPKFVVHTATHLAAKFKMTFSEFERQTDQNATHFFNLKR